MSDKWSNKLSGWNASPSSDMDIAKARLKREDPERGVRSMMSDPLAITSAMGFKDRRYSLTYDILKRIPHQLAVVAAVIQTRCNQVGSFAVPYRTSKSIGFQIKHKNPARLTTKGEREFILDLERYIAKCGQPQENPLSRHKRDDFETFLKKIVRDSLTYDQTTFEIVPDKRGLPYEFVAVDASTIRIAAPTANSYNAMVWGKKNSVGENTFGTMQLDRDGVKKGEPAFVQVINGRIENVYERDELAFGIRNPRTDLNVQGYGYGELEMLISTITSHLYAEEYNRRFFMQGSAPKGLLNFKGDAMSPDQLEGFRRMWRAQMEGVENSWRTPILQSEQGVEWIDLHTSNREMEYGQWLEYLIKLTCSVFLIDPAEINFDLHGGVQQTPLFESSQEWKLKASRDRGLRPLLRFIANMINDQIISKIDDHFVLDFTGLDELTEQEKHDLRKEQVSSYMTLNEIRRAEDLPDVEDGDMVLNPTYLQARQLRIQEEQQKQQAEQQAAQQGAPAGQAPQEGEGQEPQQEENPNEHVPQYSDSFGG